MKKIYLIHGWGGTGSGGWFDWIKKEMKDKAEVISFDMPNTDEPKIEEWVGFLKENVKNIDEDTYFIGHSVGCQTILRFLESLLGKIKIAGVVLVAPWMELDENTIKEGGIEVEEIAKPWMETPIDFDKVKGKCKKFLAIFSDNDPYVKLDQVKEFQKNLKVRTIIKENEEHFNETREMPEILDFILKK